jgi:hypothetical protein
VEDHVQKVQEAYHQSLDVVILLRIQVDHQKETQMEIQVVVDLHFLVLADFLEDQEDLQIQVQNHALEEILLPQVVTWAVMVASCLLVVVVVEIPPQQMLVLVEAYLVLYNKRCDKCSTSLTNSTTT